MRDEQCAALLRALDVLGKTQVELARISSGGGKRHRQDLIAVRRARNLQIAEVGTLADELFGEVGDIALLTDYRRLSSAARSAAASHQARWSAAHVGVFEHEYRSSAREAGDAYRLFSEWMRNAIVKIIER